MLWLLIRIANEAIQMSTRNICFFWRNDKKYLSIIIGPGDSVVEQPLQEREIVGSKPGRTIPRLYKWYHWLPCLVLSIIRQALASLLLTNISQLTSQHLQTQRTNGPVNAHLISRPTISTKTNFAKFDTVLKWVKVNSGSPFI